MGPHGGGVEGEVAEEPGQVERAPIASWEGMRRSEKSQSVRGGSKEEGWRRRSQGMEDGLRIERRRSSRESRESLLQGGRAQGEVRKPKCQRRLY